MNLPAVVIFSDKGDELEKFFKEKGLYCVHIRDKDELKRSLLEEDIAVILVEEELYHLLEEIITSSFPFQKFFPKIFVFGNSSKTISPYRSYSRYIKWPNENKDIVLSSIRVEILEYILRKQKYSIKAISNENKKNLKTSKRDKDFFYFLEKLRLLKNELNECRDIEKAIAISEKYIKQIFECDFFVLIINSKEQKFDAYGFGNSSDTELLEKFLRYSILSFKMLSGLQFQQLKDAHINRKKISINSFIWPESVSNSNISRIIDISSEIKSYMLFPMISGTKNLGCIGIGSKNEGVFDVDDLRIISFVGCELAHVFANIKLILHIRDISIKDTLTDLYNRRYFDEILRHEYLRAKRYNLPLSLIMIDIDYFKSINDTFGHLTGDKVLRELASLIKNSVRRVDVVSRFGGEEFSIILPNTPLEKASKMAERLRKIVEKHPILINKNKKINITISAGISSLREDTSSEKELLEEADKALLKAKMSGRNKVYVYMGNGVMKEVKAEGLRERRRFKRVSTNLPIEYIPLLNGRINTEDIAINATLRNISEEGISFESSEDLEKNDLLLVSFDIPLNEIKYRVRAIAQIVWNKKEENKNIAGAKLITLDSHIKKVIKEYIFSKI